MSDKASGQDLRNPANCKRSRNRRRHRARSNPADRPRSPLSNRFRGNGLRHLLAARLEAPIRDCEIGCTARADPRSARALFVNWEFLDLVIAVRRERRQRLRCSARPFDLQCQLVLPDANLLARIGNSYRLSRDPLPGSDQSPANLRARTRKEAMAQFRKASDLDAELNRPVLNAATYVRCCQGAEPGTPQRIGRRSPCGVRPRLSNR